MTNIALKLTGTTLKVHHQIILEPSLETYRQFTELYNLAFSLIDPSDSFATAWAANEGFRNALCQALLKYGLDEVSLATLTSTQMSELLLVSEDGPGLIFRQNNAFPNLNMISENQTTESRHLEYLKSNWRSILRQLCSIGLSYVSPGLSTKFSQSTPKKPTPLS